MLNDAESALTKWCIVVADNHGSARTKNGDRDPRPEQYRRMGNVLTLLQRTVHRATRIAPASQILVTVLADYRARWAPWISLFWPGRRFVSDHRCASLLSSAGAILSAAASSPSDAITILPARRYVVHGEILRCALRRAISSSPEIAEFGCDRSEELRATSVSE